MAASYNVTMAARWSAVRNMYHFRALIIVYMNLPASYYDMQHVPRNLSQMSGDTELLLVKNSPSDFKLLRSCCWKLRKGEGNRWLSRAALFGHLVSYNGPTRPSVWSAYYWAFQQRTDNLTTCKILSRSRYPCSGCNMTRVLLLISVSRSQDTWIAAIDIAGLVVVYHRLVSPFTSPHFPWIFLLGIYEGAGLSREISGERWTVANCGCCCLHTEHSWGLREAAISVVKWARFCIWTAL